MTVIRLPWTKPPLSLNDRTHWAAKARTTREVRLQAAWACAGLPPADHITVELVYIPRAAGRRDSDNLVATLKPLCDGIVDAGIVPDDTPVHMTKVMPRIADPRPRDPRLELHVTYGPPPAPPAGTPVQGVLL